MSLILCQSEVQSFTFEVCLISLFQCISTLGFTCGMPFLFYFIFYFHLFSSLSLLTVKHSFKSTQDSLYDQVQLKIYCKMYHANYNYIRGVNNYQECVLGLPSTTHQHVFVVFVCFFVVYP